MAYSPKQPRDKDGKWKNMGGKKRKNKDILKMALDSKKYGHASGIAQDYFSKRFNPGNKPSKRQVKRGGPDAWYEHNARRVQADQIRGLLGRKTKGHARRDAARYAGIS